MDINMLKLHKFVLRAMNQYVPLLVISKYISRKSQVPFLQRVSLIVLSSLSIFQLEVVQNRFACTFRGGGCSK